MSFAYGLTYNSQGELWFINQVGWTGHGGCPLGPEERISVHEFRSVGRSMRLRRERDHQDGLAELAVEIDRGDSSSSTLERIKKLLPWHGRLRRLQGKLNHCNEHWRPYTFHRMVLR